MITDELREYAGNLGSLVYASTANVKRTLEEIADRIDAEHESACAAAYGNGVESVALPDMTNYIELPKDADGEPIRVGDRIEYNTGGIDTVRFLTLNRDGWMVNERGWKAETMRHVKPDSWERIIEDAAKNIYPNGAFNPCWDEVRDALVERCKRLAGEA